jgi:virulence-associated protein VapD
MKYWAIVYDVDIAGLKEAGYTKSQVVHFYNEIQSCFSESNFAKSQQLTLYMSDQPNAVPDAFQVSRCLARVPDADKFLTRVYLMRIDELHDLLPTIVHGKTSRLEDRIWSEIERLFPDDL